jgi:hypothetical protein
VRRSERPISSLPAILLIGFALLLAAQVYTHHVGRQQLETRYRPLGKPFGGEIYREMSMGSEQLMGYLLAIRLQLHDNQIGRHFRYSLIDYDLLIDWLEQISETSPGTEYPMLLASRIYTLTNDLGRLYKILGFVERRFDDNPQLHWRRLAEACVIAKHGAEDLELALRLARKLAAQPASVEMPQWARDFEFLLLADLNEFESAIAIIQALLQSGSIKDPDEKYFLEEKLSDFQQKLFESQQSPIN